MSRKTLYRLRVVTQILNILYFLDMEHPSDYIPGGLNRDQFFQDWLSSKSNLSAQTLADYKCCVQNHLIPAFGDLAPEDLTESVVKDLFYQKQQDASLSNKSLHNLRNVLRACLDRAIDQGWLTQNPAEEILLPPVEMTAIQALSETDQQTLIKGLLEEDSNEALCILLILSTGVKIGEAAAIQCGDVELKSGLVNVNKMQILTDTGWKSRPNRGAACRKAPILSPFPEYLKRHPLGPANQPLIYRRGREQYDTSALGKLLRRRLNHLDVSVTAIQLRDTYAINLLSMGMPYQQVKAAMGFEEKSNIFRKYERYFCEEQFDSV